MNEMTGLIVDVEARITKLERGLKLANDRQRRAADQMERRAKQSADRISDTYGKMGNGIAAQFGKMKSLALPFMGGLAGGIAAGGVSAIVANLDRVAEGIANVQNEADRAGMPTEAFQEWTFVAQQNRISIDALVDGFKELNLRADEFIATGVGPAAEAFARLGFRADDLKAKLKDPSALMLEILGRLEGFDKAAQIRIADEIFGGTGGERFVELLRQGRDGIAATIDRAHEAGAVLDQELIAKADEINRRFSEMQTTAGNWAKRVVVELAAAGAELADFRARLDQVFESETEGRAIIGDELYDALSRDRDAVDAQAEALARLDERYAAAAEEADRAGMAMRGAIGQLDSWGYQDAANALRNASAELDAVTRAFRDGEISGEVFTAKLAEVEAAASDAFATLEAGDRVQFGAVMSQLSRLGSVIASVAAMADNLTSALARAAGIDDATKQTRALRDRHAAEQASMESARALAEANDRFTASERERNAATSEQIKIAREVEAVQKRASEAGATLTTTQAEELAQASIAADEARQAADRAARQSGKEASGGGSGSSREKLDEYQREAQSIREKTTALRIEAAVLAEVATSQRDRAEAVEFVEAKSRLLTAATEAGKTMTPEAIAEIDRLAEAYAKAGREAQTAGDKMAEAAEKAADNLQAGIEGVTEIFSAARKGGDALSSTLSRMADQILDNLFSNMLMGLLGGVGSGAGGGAGGFLVKLLGSALGGGFATGGYTGDGGKYEVAGPVHRGEFVLSKEATSRIGVHTLERLHKAAQSGDRDAIAQIAVEAGQPEWATPILEGAAQQITTDPTNTASKKTAYAPKGIMTPTSYGDQFTGAGLFESRDGFTGSGSAQEPAGIVHRSEFVFSRQAVESIGADNLERLHLSARKGYAGGGLVGMAGKAAKAVSDSPRASAGASSPVVTINAPVTVNASGGTPEQNADLARQVSAETERAMRSLVRDELVKQSRPGAMLGGRR